MKQVADELSINYSTAKTIVQTFRKERRIAKKPKRALETKKAVKRERYLTKLLSHSKVVKMVALIVGEESVTSSDKKSPEPTAPIVDSSTLISVPVRPEAETQHKAFPRITSANQMVLFPAEEDGPKPGQVSCAVATDPLSFPFSRKDVFYVYSESNPEEEYKGKVDYANPVLLRAKLSSPAVESLAAQGQLLLQTQPFPRTISAPLLAGFDVQGPAFDFQEYARRIRVDPFER